ncbi:hypothetical protein Bbelb_231140 [Branchiostoma belcheri]|nr:hypothetical protein Bbelb_231140 [Branchiostoma belcheri]
MSSSAEGQQQAQTETTGALPGELANSDPTSVAWRREPRGPELAGSPLTFAQLGALSLADAGANTPNTLYVSRADAAYAADANGRKKKCLGLCKKLWQFTIVVFVVANAILLPYFAVKTTMLAEEFAKLNRKTESRLSELNLKTTVYSEETARLAEEFAKLNRKTELRLSELNCSPGPPGAKGAMGRLALQAKRGPLVLREKRGPWGPLALCRLGHVENRGRWALQGRPVYRDAPSAPLDHRDIHKQPDASSQLEVTHHFTFVPCPEGYTKWHRGTCYKFFSTPKTFSEADQICRKDGGTLAMPRDDETSSYLHSLSKSQGNNYRYWIGLHYQREKGKFEWVDGSALGEYSSWYHGHPVGHHCVSSYYFTNNRAMWADIPCEWKRRSFCQAVPRPTTDLASPLISVL